MHLSAHAADRDRRRAPLDRTRSLAVAEATPLGCVRRSAFSYGPSRSRPRARPASIALAPPEGYARCDPRSSSKLAPREATDRQRRPTECRNTLCCAPPKRDTGRTPLEHTPEGMCSGPGDHRPKPMPPALSVATSPQAMTPQAVSLVCVRSRARARATMYEPTHRMMSAPARYARAPKPGPAHTRESKTPS